jgi:hypothetical protein
VPEHGAPLLADVAVEYLGEVVVRGEEPFEYLLGVVLEPVTALELALCEESLLELHLSKLVVEGPQNRVREHLESLADDAEMVEGCVVGLFREFWVPPQHQLLVGPGDLLLADVHAHLEVLVVVSSHKNVLNNKLSFIFSLAVSGNFS